MKRKNKTIMIVAMTIFAAVSLSCATDDGVMSKKKGVYTVNTTSLSQEVKGYNGPTPLVITIEKDVVKKIKALENSETPGFFRRVVDCGLLDKWNGKNVDEALNSSVDAIAGATYSSNAVIENVRLGLNYYKEHKK